MLTPDQLEFVFLGAGKGTRNYPHSKGLPHKTLVPFGSQKIVDHIVQDVIKAGGKHLTIVCSNEEAKKAFEACFEREKDVEEKFEKFGNEEGLALLRGLYLPDDFDLKFVFQRVARGTGHAMGLANQVAEGRHLCVIYPDDIVIADDKAANPKDRQSILKRVVDRYCQMGAGTLFLTREVDDPSRWGIIENGIFKEKPKQSTSRNAFIGVCCLDKKIGQMLENDALKMERGEPVEGVEPGKELYHHMPINKLAQEDPEHMAIQIYPLTSTDLYLDCGTLKGYEQALIYTLLKESVYAKEHLKFAKEIID